MPARLTALDRGAAVGVTRYRSSMHADEGDLERLVRAAERLAELADTAELMEDRSNAEHLRGLASSCRDAALDLLDRRPSTG